MGRWKNVLGSIAALLPLFATVSQAQAESCSFPRAEVYDLTSDVEIGATLTKLWSASLENAQYSEDGSIWVAYSYPLFLDRYRTGGSALISLTSVATSILDVGSTVLEPSDQALTELASELELGESPALKRAAFTIYDRIRDNEAALHTLSRYSTTSVPPPQTLQEVISRAKAPSPDAIIWQGALLGLLSGETQDGRDPSLKLSGFIKIHRNRILEDLLYLGVDCESARALAAKVNDSVLKTRRLSLTLAGHNVVYRGDSRTARVNIPVNLPAKPALRFQAKRELSAIKDVDYKKVFSGTYEFSDFAKGKFKSLEMHARGFYVLTAALSILKNFPDVEVKFSYNPDFFSARGISNLPAYFNGQARAAGIRSGRVDFQIDRTLSDSGEGFGYSWTRDMWLNARETATNKLVKLSELPISTEGGALYPIGRYFFAHASLYQGQDLESVKQSYISLTGRTPIFIGADATEDDFVTRSHIDTYMIFLPQLDGKPAIGVADEEAGIALYSSLSPSSRRRALTARYLTLQSALRVSQDERATLSVFDVNNAGMPVHLGLLSFGEELSTALYDSAWADSDQLNREARGLQAAGFKVFRFPSHPAFGQTNGFVEFDAQGSQFTTTTWGVAELDAALARTVNSFGYTLRLIPATHGIDPGAGLHCLTNENRLTDRKGGR